jgi:thiamine-monophosphate kinase
MNERRTEISSLGEFGLIDHLTQNWPLFRAESLKGIGDDAAVIDAGEEVVLLSTDMLVEGVHFDLAYTPLRHLGYKSIVVNLSDICAMNGEPSHVLVSIAISNRFPVEALEELYAGIKQACSNYKVDLIGGDTTTSRSGLVISVTAYGKTKKGEEVYRKGAAINELLVVSGDLGGAYMGLQVLEREKAVFLEAPDVQPDLSGSDYILERQLKPEARVDVRVYLKELGIQPTSMIDISDGLSSEAIHLAKASGLGLSIYEEKIPIDNATYDKAREFHLDPTLCALSGGEDYELLFTVALEDFEKIKDHPHFSIIGHMSDPAAGYILIDRNGGQHQLTAQGWDPILRA